jgi:hypothetical protein
VEGGFEGVVGDGAGLAEELVEARLGEGAVALVVDVAAVGGARGLAVEAHPEPDGTAGRGRGHDQVQVAGGEAVDDPPTGLVAHDGLLLDGPVARQRPVVEPQPWGGGIGVARIQDGASGGDEVVGAPVAEVVLGRPQAGPVGGDLHPTGVDRGQVLVGAAAAGLGQELLQHHLRHVVVALAEAVVADLPLGVDEVERRPVVVGESGPDGVVVVDRDRVVDPQVLDLLADVGEVVLEVELGGVDADHDQPLVLVALGPGADIGQGAEPVDAGVGPEVDQHDAAAELGRCQRRRVDPSGRAVETRQVPFNRQLGRGVGGRADELVGSGEERLPAAWVLVHQSLLSGSRRSGAVNLDHGLGEGLGCFLHQVVTDARPPHSG